MCGISGFGKFDNASPNRIESMTVAAIGEDAFQNCHSLTSINIPGNVTVIEDSTFRNCRNLSSVTIPMGITRIVGDPSRSCSKCV